MISEEYNTDPLSNENLMPNSTSAETILPLHEVTIKEEIRNEDDELDDSKIDVQETIIRIKEEIKREPIDDADDWEGKIKVHAVGPSEELCDEVIQDEDMKASNIVTKEPKFCGTCTDEDRWFCLKCPMVLRVLDANIPKNQVIDDKTKATLPRNILEVKEVSDNIAVYSLKTLRGGIMFGPLEGINSIPSTNGCVWKLKGGVFADIDHEKGLNWMYFVNHTKNKSTRNIDIFQYKENLYYKTCKEIEKGQELLVYFPEKQELNENNEWYFEPDIVEEITNVYGCTFCCLGFNSEAHLSKHKAVCLDILAVGTILDEIIQCVFCKVFMDKREYSKFHLDCCLKKYQRKLIKTKPSEAITIKIPKEKKTFQCNECNNCKAYTKEMLRTHLRRVHFPHQVKEFKCTKCPFECHTSAKLKKHSFTHDTVKKFQCSLCSYKKRFTNKTDLELHIKEKHPMLNCTQCQYETYNKFALRRHVMTHRIEKTYKCSFCEHEFTTERYLKVHIGNQHQNNEDFKPYACQVCKRRFVSLHGLKFHIEQKHDGIEKCPNCTSEEKKSKEKPCKLCDPKPFKCTKCNYATDYKRNLRQHLYVHDDVKPFQCDVCGKQCTTRGNLQVHMKSHKKKP